jgi:CRISPR/Cas system-associated exonuclease Cas4 (RecB family)
MNIDTVDHSERAHAEFGPSSLKYVSICAGYNGKEGTNPAAEAGTRIHEALEVRDPSALQSDEEVQIYERMYAEELEVFQNVFGGEEGVTINREMRLVLELDCKTPTFGTSDIVAWKGDIGLQIDYKTGISKIDPPNTNWQAKAYVLAAFQMYPELNTIHFAFLIPKRDEILIGTFHRFEMSKLRQEISDVIAKAEVTRSKWDSSPPDIEELNPSVNCRFCKYEDRCPALGAVAIGIAKQYRPDLMPSGSIDPADIDNPETAEKLYAVAKIMESWAKGTKFKVTGMAHEGVEFEGLYLRSMGALKKTIEKNYLAQLAIQHGLTLQEVIEAADLTLNQLSEALHAKSPKGKKSFIVDSFQKEAMDTGVVEVGPTRYTLSSR